MKFLIATMSLLVSKFSEANTEIKPYGFVKTSVVSSSQEVVSFADKNHSAVTHAARIDRSSSAAENYSRHSRSSFQTQQSRVGFSTLTNGLLRTQFEVDFVDRSESTHGSSENVRLRLAYLTLPVSENLELSAGQKWLTFSAVAPYVYNFIQLHFYSGKTGFLGQELSLKHTAGSFVNYIALGAKGVNTQSAQDSTELGEFPAFTFRSEYKFASGLVGVAYMYAQMLNSAEPLSGQKNSTSQAFKVYGDANIQNWKLTTEILYSQNPEDLNLLALAGARYNRVTGHSSFVTGGYFSARYSLNEKVNVFGGYGVAINGKAQEKFSDGTLASNQVFRLGIDKKVIESARLFIEMSHFETGYVTAFQSIERARANVYDIGLLIPF